MFHRIRRIARKLLHLPRDAYFTLNGWRFDDLKAHFTGEMGHNLDDVLSLNEFSKLLNYSVTAQSPTVAIVTSLPPDETGIANFSRRHLLEFQIATDVFTPVRNTSNFLHRSAEFNRFTSDKVHMNPIGLLLAKMELLSYKSIMFVIGNSDHNIEIFRAMEGAFSVIRSNYVCYLHDPCCHNLIMKAKKLSPKDYLKYIEKLYGILPAAGYSGGVDDAHVVIANLIENGIFGVRAFVDLGVRKFAVNSEAAKQIILNDIAVEDRDKVQIVKLFHPAFASVCIREDNVPENSRGALRVGSFGGPGNMKRSSVVIDAVHSLNKSGVEAELYIAGYGAKRFALNLFGNRIPRWLHLSEPENNKELEVQMCKCDIAVQLRENNLGESSGIVPDLIGMEIPTIVSPVGAFLEYGSAVLTFSGDAAQLANVLASHPTVPSENMRAYAQKHTVEKFNLALVSMMT